MASEDVKSGESAVTKIVTLAEEARLASREGVVTAATAPSYAFTTICKSLLASGVVVGVSISFYSLEVVDYDAGSAATSREGYLVGTSDEHKSAHS
ncbi:Mitochondrial adenine nucleotide transporter [Arachis hypogaea]|nr:Mitochondrial adenine nucleotide transporter [Arachis hypogaea]